MSKKERIEKLEKRMEALEKLVIDYISSQVAKELVGLSGALSEAAKSTKKATKKSKGRPKKHNLTLNLRNVEENLKQR